MQKVYCTLQYLAYFLEFFSRGGFKDFNRHIRYTHIQIYSY